MTIGNLKVDPASPPASVEACIRETLGAQAAAQAVLRPQRASACDPEVDSLVVIEVICAVEELLGIKLPPAFVPRGGYQDVESCVKALLRMAQAVWDEHVKKVEGAAL